MSEPNSGSEPEPSSLVANLMVVDSRATASVKQPNRATSSSAGDTDVTTPSAPRTPATPTPAKLTTNSGAACSPTPDVGKDRYFHQMKSAAGSMFGPPGWRALLSFWVLILSFGITTVLLLQALGPPLRHTERTVISSRPAEPASGRQIGNPPPPSPPPDRNPLRVIKDRTTGAHPAMESLAQSPVPLSRAPPGDLEQAMDTKLQLYERAQEAAAAGKFDEADNALALADKLALQLPTPTVPPVSAAAELPNGEGMTHSSAIASKPKADTDLLRTPLPPGRKSEVVASRVPAAAPVPPVDPPKHAQPAAGAASQSTTREEVAGSSETASQRNAETGLLRRPLPSGRNSEVVASRVPAAASVPPVDPPKGAQRIPDPILIVHFLKGSASAPTEIHQLAAILGSRFSQIKLAAEDRVRPKAIIQYYSVRDHPTTSDIGRELGRMGYRWEIEHVTTQRSESPSDVVDVWIPPKLPHPEAAPDHGAAGAENSVYESHTETAGTELAPSSASTSQFQTASDSAARSDSTLNLRLLGYYAQDGDGKWVWLSAGSGDGPPRRP